MSVSKVSFQPLGYVRRKSKMEDVRDRSLIAEIVLRKELKAGLDGLEDFSHILVIFFMHQLQRKETEVLKVHPQGRMDLPLVGVFATRTAFRPNPVGLTVVELLKRKQNVLLVKGLDAFDRTPVLDLKPYDHRDVVQGIRVPEWWKKLEEEKRSPCKKKTSQKH